ncbi:helix-turn-helix domain-containing protein [Streptomyces sp. NBC_00715]|uniref:helix-turn-helix domain-containing protein n=1 Tax=Streptomyces sp. NBC_00715 TaxID=2975811 RepID=UPI00386FCD7B
MEDQAAAFGRYISDAARAVGYDIDSPRGGARKALAEATGMSPSSVGRTLSGKSVPDRSVFRSLAAALELSTEDLLRVAGTLGGPAPAPPPERPLTITDAARRLGIREARNVAAFEVLVAALQRSEADGSDGSAQAV